MHDQLLHVGEAVDDQLRSCQVRHLGGGQTHTKPLHLGQPAARLAAKKVKIEFAISKLNLGRALNNLMMLERLLNLDPCRWRGNSAHIAPPTSTPT